MCDMCMKPCKSADGIKRTSSTIDSLSELSSTRSRTNSSSSSMATTSSLTSSNSSMKNECTDSDSESNSDSDSDLDMDEDDEDEPELDEETRRRHIELAATQVKSKPMGRLRRFSLNLPFLKSSPVTANAHNKNFTVARSAKIASPTSASLTNDFDGESLRRFQFNKRLFQIIRKKKVTF